MREASDALRDAAADLAKGAKADDLGDHMWAVARWLLYRAAAMDVNAELERERLAEATKS